MLLKSFFIILALAVFTDGIVQNALLLTGLVLLSAHLSRRYDTTKTFFFVTLGITCLHVIFMVLQFNEARSLGFDDGLYFGIINNQLYQDTSYYYNESKILASVLSGRDLMVWISGNYPNFGFYGPYHFQNIITGLEMVVFGDNLITIILIKYVSNIVTYYLIYRICDKYLFVKNKTALVIALSLSPSYILASSSLLRDNIILLFIVLLVYHYFIILKSEPVTRQQLIRFFMLVVIAFFIRAYTLLFVVGMLVHYVLEKKVTVKKIAAIVAMALVFVAGIIYLFNNVSGINTLLSNFIDYDNSNAWFQANTQGIRAVIYALYFVTSFGTMKFPMGEGMIYPEQLNILSMAYLSIVSSFATMAIFYKTLIKRDYAVRFILIFGFIVPFIFCLSHTIALGAVIPRIYDMWIWLLLLFIVQFLETVRENLRYFAAGTVVVYLTCLNIILKMF